MTDQFEDQTGRCVTVSEITEDNWRDVADVAPHDYQRGFVPALAARYLLLSMREGLWHSLAVEADGIVVGHVMWAYDTDADAHCIGGMVIAASEQGKGVGRATLGATIALLSELPGAREIQLSYHPDNTVAAELYESFSFRANGDFEDDEIVAALPVANLSP